MDSITFGTQRLVHLDFKGAPPKISYLERLFPTLRDWGATGLLIEWEDTFPYQKELRPLGGLSEGSAAAGAPYTLEEVRHILNIAADCGLAVIPLIQTLGHMEFVLKHPEWSGLREVDAFPSSMCPSHSDAQPLVRSMLRQVIALHRPAQLQYIHIGADEVWHMAMCASCSRRAQDSRHGRASLFLDHLTAVAAFLKEAHPHLKVIVWDDMLRNIDLNVLQEYDLGRLVEPMVWHYQPREQFQLGPALWEKYSNVFPRIWAASAFKGATGSCQIVPIVKHHVSNHEGWLNEIEQHGSKIQRFMGIALTGWSRYDHYATLCELLPPSLGSLAACLRVWLGGAGPASLGQVQDPPGWQLLRGANAFLALRDKYRSVAHGDQVQTWLNQWQVSSRYTNPMQIQSLSPMLNELLNESNSVEVFMKSQMDAIYYPPTVAEWLGSNLAPVRSHLQQLKADVDFQLTLGCGVRGLRKLC